MDAENALWPAWGDRLKPVLTFERGLHHPARGPCPMHAHAAAELVFHPRGEGVTTNPDHGELRFRPGDCVFYPAGFYHDQRVTRSDDDCCLQFRLHDPVPPRLRSWFVVATGDDASLRDELIALARCGRREDRSDATCLDLRCTTALLRLCQQHTEDRRLPAQVLADRARALIAERCDQDWTIAGIAEVLGVGEDHLRHSFTKRHGISPLRHLIECRIAKAKDLLLHAPVTVREAGEASGFANAQVFAASFRRETGMSPRAWRERNR